MRVVMACFVSVLLVGTASAASRLATDRRAYDTGEVTVFTLHNDSADAMSWESISDYPVVSLLLGGGEEEVVREPPLVVLEALGVLLPREEKTWEWDQRDYHQWYDQVDDLVDRRKQVPPGRYLARFQTLEHGEFETPTFVVGVPADVDARGKIATTWARLKTSP